MSVPAIMKLAIIALSFEDNPLTADLNEIELWAFSHAPDGLDTYYENESNGRITFQGRVFPVTIPPQEGCNNIAWMAEAKKKLLEQGESLDDYYHFSLVMNKIPSCAWYGLGQCPGPWSWVSWRGKTAFDGFKFTVIHELTHNFGIKHAASSSCTDEAGNPVIFSDTCTTKEYGNGLNVMGAPWSLKGMSAIQKRALYWIPEKSVKIIEGNGLYVLNEYVQLLYLPRTENETFAFELKRPTGFDKELKTPGVLAYHIVNSDIHGNYFTRLLDSNPSTETITDAPLREGAIFIDPKTGVEVTIASITDLGAALIVKNNYPSAEVKNNWFEPYYDVNGAWGCSISMNKNSPGVFAILLFVFFLWRASRDMDRQEW